MLMIHVGVLASEFPTFEAQMARFTELHEIPALIPNTDNDSWTEWGAPPLPYVSSVVNWGRPDWPGPDSDKTDLLIHVTMMTDMPQRDLQFVHDHFRGFMHEMGEDAGKYQYIKMCLTDGKDHSERYTEFDWEPGKPQELPPFPFVIPGMPGMS